MGHSARSPAQILVVECSGWMTQVVHGVHFPTSSPRSVSSEQYLAALPQDAALLFFVFSSVSHSSTLGSLVSEGEVDAFLKPQGTAGHS